MPICLIFGVFRPFTLNVIVDTLDLKSVFIFFLFCFHISVFVFQASCGLLNIFRIPFSFFYSIFSISVYIAYLVVTLRIMGIPCDTEVKNSPAMQEMHTCRRCRFNPWVRRYCREGNGNPLQYSCLGNPYT